MWRRDVSAFGWGDYWTVGEEESKKEMEAPEEAGRPGRQGSGLMRNTLLQAQCSHVNFITPFLGVSAFRLDLGWVFSSN